VLDESPAARERCVGTPLGAIHALVREVLIVAKHGGEWSTEPTGVHFSDERAEHRCVAQDQAHLVRYLPEQCRDLLALGEGRRERLLAEHRSAACYGCPHDLEVLRSPGTHPDHIARVEQRLDLVGDDRVVRSSEPRRSPPVGVVRGDDTGVDDPCIAEPPDRE
jgi:hypothetical protein